MSRKIKVGSDFSGVGAFNQALIRLGIDYEEVFACDIDKYARTTFIHNYGEPKYYPENVYDREIPTDPLDIYVTSPPCQSFSLAGKRGGENDDRGILFYNSHEFIKKNKPRFFIFENVKGLLSDDKGRTFGKWIEHLGGKSVNGNPVLFPCENSVPYHIYYKVLNAKHHGVPQNRERIFIIGIRDDKDNYFRFPLEEPLKLRLKDVLEDNVDEKYYLSDKMIDLFVRHTEKHQQKGNGFKFKPKENESVAQAVTTKAGTRPDDNYIKVPSATSKGYEIATENDSINFARPNSKSRRGRVGKGVAQTITTQQEQGVLISAFRGRNPNNHSDRTTEQRLEINKQGVSNTLTSVQKDNVIVYGNLKGGKWDKNHEQSRRVYDVNGVAATLHTMGGGNQEPKVAIIDDIYNNREERIYDKLSPTIRSERQGLKVIVKKEAPSPELVGGIGEMNFGKQHRQGNRVYSSDKTAMCLLSNPVGNTGGYSYLYQVGYRIRKLTPRECFRLMDFPDTFDFSVVSNSQAYKQAGNSIVVRMLELIIKEFRL